MTEMDKGLDHSFKVICKERCSTAGEFVRTFGIPKIVGVFKAVLGRA